MANKLIADPIVSDLKFNHPIARGVFLKYFIFMEKH